MPKPVKCRLCCAESCDTREGTREPTPRKTGTLGDLRADNNRSKPYDPHKASDPDWNFTTSWLSVSEIVPAGQYLKEIGPLGSLPNKVLGCEDQTDNQMRTAVRLRALTTHCCC